MVHRLWVVGVALAFSANVNASGIYKCVSGDGTAYQSFPCTSGSEQVLSVTTTAEPLARQAPVVDDSTAQGQWNQIADTAGEVSAARPVFARDTLALGITDDQALNTPGWGPPKKIMRHRERSGWREVWTYARKAGGAPQLEFFNGRLVAISVQSESADASGVVLLAP